MNLKSAINQLDISAEACENNAPIHESQGNCEQANASRENATSMREAIQILKRAQFAFDSDPIRFQTEIAQ